MLAAGVAAGLLGAFSMPAPVRAVAYIAGHMRHVIRLLNMVCITTGTLIKVKALPMYPDHFIACVA